MPAHGHEDGGDGDGGVGAEAAEAAGALVGQRCACASCAQACCAVCVGRKPWHVVPLAACLLSDGADRPKGLQEGRALGAAGSTFASAA